VKPHVLRNPVWYGVLETEKHRVGQRISLEVAEKLACNPTCYSGLLEPNICLPNSRILESTVSHTI
jgi:hypothetical protein